VLFTIASLVYLELQVGGISFFFQNADGKKPVMVGFFMLVKKVTISNIEERSGK
jgi:hypothetical protein